jgi:hypothetical protein
MATRLGRLILHVVTPCSNLRLGGSGESLPGAQAQDLDRTRQEKDTSRQATVKTHLLHIYAKLGVTDRAAAVAEAFNRGLLGTSREP